MKQTERSELTRKKILSAALSEFGIRGYAGTMINEICREGKINKGLFYHHFSGKEDLYLACLQQAVSHLSSWIDEHHAEESLDAYMASRLAFYEAYPEESRVIYEALFLADREIYVRVQEILEPISSQNATLFEKTIAGLQLRDGVTKEKAMAYFALLEKMFNGYFAGPAMQQLDMKERIALHEKTAPLVLEGMLFGIAEKEEKS